MGNKLVVAEYLIDLFGVFAKRPRKRQGYEYRGNSPPVHQAWGGIVTNEGRS